MFTGIVEHIAIVEKIEHEGTNRIFTFSSAIASELKVDQSVSHDGVCLTVTELLPGAYKVTAIEETLKKTALSEWRVGKKVNIERAMPANGRLDGHFVQGHVDTVGLCQKVEDRNGSWNFFFSHAKDSNHITVPKGSIAINGVSLTVVDSTSESFSVSIIPYTYDYTNFNQLNPGDKVNLEFDIIGQYISRLIKNQLN